MDLRTGNGSLARYSTIRHPIPYARPLISFRTCARHWLAFCFLFTFLVILYLPFLRHGSRRPIAFVWPSDQTRDTRQLVLPDNATTLIHPQNVCRMDQSKSPSLSNATYLLVVVHSAVRNFIERTAIRNSWAKDQKKLPNVKVIFLVGTLKNDTETREAINNESQEHGDVLQENFIDSYVNLTVKSLMMLKWFNHNCDKIPYVLKADDDMFINLHQLFQLVTSNQKPNILIGSLICGAIPIKDPYNKWYVPAYMFEGKMYPNYLSGTAYLMSRSTALVLYEASLDIPIFHLEDIYVTGILSKQARIKPEDDQRFTYLKRKLNPCVYKQAISSHHVSPKEMVNIYGRMQESRPKCNKIKTTSRKLVNVGQGKCLWKKVT